jgi:hypothetical protein
MLLSMRMKLRLEYDETAYELVTDYDETHHPVQVGQSLCHMMLEVLAAQLRPEASHAKPRRIAILHDALTAVGQTKPRNA